MRRLTLAALLLLGSSGCAGFWQYLRLYTRGEEAPASSSPAPAPAPKAEEPPPPPFYPPTLAFKEVKVADLTLAGLTLDSTWEVRNPNAQPLPLASVEYALLVNGRRVAAGAPAVSSVPANGAVTLRFPAAVRFLEVGGALVSFLAQPTSGYRVEGAVGLDTPKGLVKLPMATEGTFEVPKLPEVRFAGARVSQMSFTSATVDFSLAVTNRNGFPLPVSQVAGALLVADAPVGRLATGDLGSLPPRGARTLTLPVTVDFLASGQAAVAALRGSQAKVRFDAKVSSGGVEVPLDVQQVVAVQR